ncbi:SH3 domain-containing protein [Gilvibacter sp.]|uniref:SH3 domain-containing protein n=1 Tax=Gilvibacter sp. TaxID=2729997 RepID=UPI003F4A186B
MKRVFTIIFLTISFVFTSCNNSGGSGILTNTDDLISGKWGSEKKGRYSKLPETTLDIKIKGNSIIIQRNWNYYATPESKTITGTRSDEKDKFELSDGTVLSINEELGLLYIKNEFGGEEYKRYDVNIEATSAQTSQQPKKELTEEEKAINSNQGEPEIKMAVINDPDGYTNLREQSSTKSKVIEKILDNQEFEVYVEDKLTDDWWFVYNPKTGNSGYIHKSRVNFISK